MDYYGADAIDQDGFPDLTPLKILRTRDGAADDFEERDLIFHRISNLITVRSDVFTAYVLVRIGAERGRKTKPGLKLGVCGEHGGDPESIDLFYNAGLDYVSCSPFRVPIARLSAAQSVIAAEV